MDGRRLRVCDALRYEPSIKLARHLCVAISISSSAGSGRTSLVEVFILLILMLFLILGFSFSLGRCLGLSGSSSLMHLGHLSSSFLEHGTTLKGLELAIDQGAQSDEGVTVARGAKLVGSEIAGVALRDESEDRGGCLGL
jgi:hypothetical protein